LLRRVSDANGASLRRRRAWRPQLMRITLGGNHPHMSVRSVHEDDLPWVKSVGEVATLPTTTETVLVRHLTDEIAIALTRLPSLRALVHDGNSDITDRGLEALARIKTLERLDLCAPGA
jgi:hypothetical protein